MRKFQLIFLVVLVGIIFGIGYLHLSKEFLIRNRIQSRLEAITGMNVLLGDLQVGPRGENIRLEGIEMMNPEGFESPVLARISNVVMKFDMGAFLRLQGVYFEKIEAQVKEINVERSQSGRLNLGELKAVSEEVLEEEIILPEGGKRPAFFIKRLALKFGKVRYREFILDQKEPQEKEIDFRNRLEVYEGVIDPHVLVQAPVFKVVMALGKGSMGLRRSKILQKIRGTIGIKP